MKLRYKFVVREIGGKSVAVAVGKDNEKFNGMVKLNSTAELIFKMLNEGETTESEIVSALVEKYEVTEELAKKTVSDFIGQLRQSDILSE